jgi:hypothetical protein
VVVALVPALLPVLDASLAKIDTFEGGWTVGVAVAGTPVHTFVLAVLLVSRRDRREHLIELGELAERNTQLRPSETVQAADVE